MPVYKVELARVSTRTTDFMIDADNIDEACRKAMEEAGNLQYGNEVDAEYHVTGVRKV